MREAFLLRAATCLLLLLVTRSASAAHQPAIDAGFRLLYELRFEQARAQFHFWQEAHPKEPLGYASLAASYLFEEFYDQGVLTSEFFLDNKKLLEGIPGRANERRRMVFLAENRRAQELARQRLQSNPKDPDAFFVLTITTGMLADYAGLIEKRHLESLKFTRQAENYAKDLLVVDPDSADAYLTLGAANYIIGSLPSYKRLFLWFGGIRGDRSRGMHQLEKAAMGGHYLRPFAQILLALVALREKQFTRAQRLLEQLVEEFPTNPLFRRERALLGQGEPLSRTPTTTTPAH